jgi:hypothetical protein
MMRKIRERLKRAERHTPTHPAERVRILEVWGQREGQSEPTLLDVFNVGDDEPEPKTTLPGNPGAGAE